MTDFSRNLQYNSSHIVPTERNNYVDSVLCEEESMRRHLYLVGLLLMLLAACDGAHQNPSHTASHDRHSKPLLETKKGALKTTKLVKSRATKQSGPSNPELVTVKVTNVAKFEFDDDELEQQLLDNGSYNPKSAEPYQVIEDVHSRNRMFVSTPVVKSGIPASLSTVPYDGPSDLQLKPYPSLEMHRTTEDTITDCTKQIVSIAPITKTWTDDDTLYALDTGVLNILSSPNHVCSPKIIIFDLLKDEIVSTTIIENAACSSLYVVMWVEKCPAGGLVAYSADSFGFRLTVTDLVSGHSRHLQSQYFYPKPGFFFTKAGGPSTYLAFGLAGIAADSSCYGKVYMQAFASNIQGVIDKQVIYDANDGQVMDAITQLAIPGELPGTSGPLVLDPSGERLFFPIQDELAVYCWNTSKLHHPSNFRLIARDNKRMQYISNMQIDPTTGRLWMLTNRFPAFVSNAINYSDDNYYIMYISINGIEC